MNRVSLVIFEGGMPGSQIEEQVAQVRKAVVLDNLEKFSEVAELDDVFLYTTYEDLAKLRLLSESRARSYLLSNIFTSERLLPR